MRRQKELTQHAVTNGLSANGIPPPSTIAAQIVQHQSNANARREPENRALFGKLLQEYLNDPAAEESDAHINARLIHVIAEAGLDVLHKENPFAQELLVPQAIKSIAVITLVIQRYPKTLLFVEPAGNHGTPVPLLLWLFPKLLSLLGKSVSNALQESIGSLLSLCIGTLSEKGRPWQDAASILHLYRSCVDGEHVSPVSITLPYLYLSRGHIPPKSCTGVV